MSTKLDAMQRLLSWLTARLSAPESPTAHDCDQALRLLSGQLMGSRAYVTDSFVLPYDSVRTAVADDGTVAIVGVRTEGGASRSEVIVRAPDGRRSRLYRAAGTLLGVQFVDGSNEAVIHDVSSPEGSRLVWGGESAFLPGGNDDPVRNPQCFESAGERFAVWRHVGGAAFRCRFTKAGNAVPVPYEGHTGRMRPLGGEVFRVDDSGTREVLHWGAHRLELPSRERFEAGSHLAPDGSMQFLVRAPEGYRAVRWHNGVVQWHLLREDLIVASGAGGIHVIGLSDWKIHALTADGFVEVGSIKPGSLSSSPTYGWKSHDLGNGNVALSGRTEPPAPSPLDALNWVVMRDADGRWVGKTTSHQRVHAIWGGVGHCVEGGQKRVFQWRGPSGVRTFPLYADAGDPVPVTIVDAGPAFLTTVFVDGTLHLIRYPIG